jgi:hypothetical protein
MRAPAVCVRTWVRYRVSITPVIGRARTWYGGKITIHPSSATRLSAEALMHDAVPANSYSEGSVVWMSLPGLSVYTAYCRKP